MKNEEKGCHDEFRDGKLVIGGHTLDELRDMDSEKALRIFAKYINECEDKRNDDDYIMNRPQWIKLLTVMNYFDSLRGECEPCYIRPSDQNGGVTAYFTLVDLRNKEEVQRFCNVLSLTDALCIDSTIDGKACISVTVSDVFVKRDDC